MTCTQIWKAIVAKVERRVDIPADVPGLQDAGSDRYFAIL
jgi:hypothetical protein